MNLLRKYFILLSLLMLLPLTGLAQSWSMQASADSLENIFQTATKDSTKLSALINLSNLFGSQDPKKSIEYAQKAIDFSIHSKLNQPPELYFYMGRAYERVSEQNQALEAFKKALSLAEKSGNLESIAFAYNYLGFHYYKIRDMIASIEAYNKALARAKEGDVKTAESEAYFGLAMVYSLLMDPENQLNALRHYLALADFKKEQRRISDAYRLMGEYYRTKKNYGKAVEYCQNAYDMAKSINDSSLMGVAINHLAWTYYEKGDLKKSLETYNKNIEFTHEQGRPQTLANIFGNIGNIYRDWERYPEALDYYQKSLTISEKSGDIFNQSWLYEDISRLYEHMGKYQDALANYKLHAIYYDSLQTITYARNLSAATRDYEVEKKARELELVTLKLEKNNYLIYGLIAGIVALLLISLLVIIQSRTKATQRLEAMKHRISELTQVNLRQQMNPHFIFNTLNSIQYYVFQNDKISSNNYMTKFASLMRKTLENSRHTAIPIKEELDSLELYLELEALRFKEKFDWTINVDEDIDVLLYKIPTMLIQPYAENSITHGLMNKEGKGNIMIDLKLLSDSILISIEDNGIGRQKAMQIKNEKNRNHQSLGTTITESRLKLVNELYGKSMKIKYTDLKDEEGSPTGTRVEIHIPIIT